jgi:hypothetical protein
MNQLGVVSCVAFFLLAAGYLLGLQWWALRQSRWTRLSFRYPSHILSSAQARTFTDCTVRINAHWYWRVASIGLGTTGLSIDFQAPILRLRHRPVLIPWDDLTPAGSPAEGMLLLRAGEDATITLKDSAALAMVQLFTHRASRRVTRPSRRAQ